MQMVEMHSLNLSKICSEIQPYNLKKKVVSFLDIKAIAKSVTSADVEYVKMLKDLPLKLRYQR